MYKERKKEKKTCTHNSTAVPHQCCNNYYAEKYLFI